MSPGGFPEEQVRQLAQLRKMAELVEADEPDLEIERLYLEGDMEGMLRRVEGLPVADANNYKDGGGGWLPAYLGGSHRFMAQMQSERERRREASSERWAERRDILKRKARAAKRRQGSERRSAQTAVPCVS